jgi:hypothetical protein
MNDPRPEAEIGAAEPQDSARRRATPAVTCIAALPPHREEPRSLIAAMARRGLPVICHRSVYDALLAILTLEGEGAAALILVDPDLFPDSQAHRLAKVAAQHVDRLALWRYDEREGKADLRPFEIRDATDHANRDAGTQPIAPAQEAASPVSSPVVGPRLRLAGLDDGGERREEDERTPEIPESLEDLLTREEIAMLLDDSDEDASSGTRGEGRA